MTRLSPPWIVLPLNPLFLGLPVLGDSQPRSSNANGMQPDDQAVSPFVSEGSMDVQIIESAGEDVTPKNKGNHCAAEASDDEGIVDKATDNDSAAKSAAETTDGQGVTAETRSSRGAAKSATETPAGEGITAKNRSSGGAAKSAMKTPASQGVKKKAMVSDSAKRAGMLRKVTSSKRVTFAETTTTDEPMEVDPSPPKRPASPVPEDDSQAKPKKSRVSKASGKWHIYNNKKHHYMFICVLLIV